MKKRNNIIFWPPRLFAIFFILLVGLLSMDVFGVGYSLWETLIAFLMHNIPTFLLAGVLFISWRWEMIGGVLWVLAGLSFYLFIARGTHMEGAIIVSGTPVTIGLLFIVQYFLEKNRK